MRRVLSSSLNRFILLMYVYITLCYVFSSCAQAQDVYEVYRLPEGQQLTVQGQTYRAYTFSEYKLLLRIDSDLKASDKQLQLRLTELAALRANLEDYQKLLALTESQVKMAESEVTRKDELITDLTKKNISLFEQLETRKRLVRIGGGVIGALAVGVVTGFLLAK